MKTTIKLSLAALAAAVSFTAQAHPGHDHGSATANVVHAVEGVTTTDQDKVAKAEKTATEQAKRAAKKEQKVQK